MAAHRHHGVVPICRVLQVAPSAVRSAMSRPVCARRLADDAIKPRLLEVFDANYRVYGGRTMKGALRREHGINLDKDRIARLCVSWAFAARHAPAARSRPVLIGPRRGRRIW